MTTRRRPFLEQILVQMFGCTNVCTSGHDT